MTSFKHLQTVSTSVRLWRKNALCLAVLCTFGGISAAIAQETPVGSVPAEVKPAATPVPAVKKAPIKGRIVPPTALNLKKLNEQENIPNATLTGRLMFGILGAELAAQRGEYGTAYQTFLHLAKETRDPRLARRAAELAFSAKQQNDALTASRLWYEMSPRSELAEQAVEWLLIASNKWDELAPILKAQLQKVPLEKRGALLLEMQTQLSRNVQTQGVVKVLEEVSTDIQDQAETQVAIGRAKFLAKDKNGAIRALEKAIQLKPNYEPAVLLLADIDDEHRAENIVRVKTFLKQNPKSRDGRLLLAKLLISQERYDEAQLEFESVNRDNPKDSQVVMALALLDLQRSRWDSAEKHLLDYLRLTDDEKATANKGATVMQLPGRNAAYQYLAQIAEERKDYANAEKWLDKINDPALVLSNQVKRAQYKALQGQLEEALKIIRNVRENPRVQENPQMVDAMARAEIGLLIEGKDYAQAVKQMDVLLAKNPKDVGLLFESSMGLERLKRYDEMEVRLRKVIALDPNNALALNALGYSLADRNINLPEAQDLLDKAIRIAPKEAMIIDSLGWLNYRLGKLTEAETLLQQAYAQLSDVEIGAHLGEVLWQQGKQKEALAIWIKAEKIDPNNKVLKETQQRMLRQNASSSPSGNLGSQTIQPMPSTVTE